mmetsp:Transcript_24094/g.42778  ORF Transcript_24094/g.42778 Transcript_24094/m.42778 type:complete len:479 (+) Transcript_24094:1265-2701(+)
MGSFSKAFLADPASCSHLPEANCIACSLRMLLLNYKQCKESQGGALDITDLRTALAAVYGTRFKISEREDSTEALWAVLRAVHASNIGELSQGANTDASERPCNPRCVVHRTFALEIAEQYECRCSATSELTTWNFLTFSLPLYTGSILATTYPGLASIPEDQLMANWDKSAVIASLNQLPGLLSRDICKESKVCAEESSSCQFKDSKSRTYLLNNPSIFSVSLVWPHICPKPSEVLRVMAAFPPFIRMSHIFSQKFDNEEDFSLSGFILYGLGHYIGVFKSESSGNWRIFDDNYVREVGNFNSYYEVIVDTINRNFYPVLTFYEKRRIIPEPPITHIQWMNLEKWTNALDIYRQDLQAELAEFDEAGLLAESQQMYQSLRETPSQASTDVNLVTDIRDTLSSMSRGLANPPPAANVEGSRDYWVCDGCGAMNVEDWLICIKCESIKQGVDGWLCPLCKTVNDGINDQKCVTCENPRV